MDSPDKFLAHEKNTSHIGPLRLSSDTLIVYPKAFTDPLYIDLTQVQGTIGGIDECKCTSNAILEPRKLVDTCVRELLDRLLLIFKDNCSVSNQCTAAMFVAMMLYGPKLEARRDSSVDLAFRRLHQGLSHSVTTGEHTTQLSFRSLAYLLNSCLYPADLKPLCDFAARRIADSQEPVSLEWLENICFACSKIYYTNDSFYEAVAHQVVAQANTGSPAACLNLLWSFSRVGKANLVDTVLVHRIGEFSAETFAGCSLQFRRRAADALRQYFPEGTWKTIAGH
ncbi:cysteinyl-tRNA synthetase, putative [Babesia ovis]|uniref:Cysteinyl-tRNA synthetase, putative n=1 Tax=Babesia ovis TaxID=5869 RepID=A0A9W5WV13_BABOV|nr:cysteinyl-tRNA synthetase, putative [Babesia ovis]